MLIILWIIINLLVSTSQAAESSQIFDLTNPHNYYDLIYSTPRNGYLESNTFSRSVFSTTATSMTVTGYSNIYNNFPLPKFAQLGIRVNGSDYTVLSFTKSGLQTFNVHLPGGAQIIEIISGPQTSMGFTTGHIYGSWPTKVIFNDDYSPSLFPPTQTQRMIIYGDSISVGDDSPLPALQNWPVLVRNAWSGSGSIIVYGYGFRSLYDDCRDTVSCRDLANLLTSQFAGISSKFIYLQVSTNDYGGSRWNASAFGANYTRLLDYIHANDPSIIIYAQTAILRGNEMAKNKHGSTLQDYRAQIKAACNARFNYCKTIDGTIILSAWEDYIDDHVHPSLVGQIKYANFVRNLLGI